MERGADAWRRVPWWVWVSTPVAVEALILLVGFGQADESISGGDAREYHRYAFNLLHHGVFSVAPDAPFHANIGRAPGYPALLAAIDLLGDSALLVRLVQFVLVAATAMVVYKVAEGVAPPPVPILAGLLVATYLPLAEFATRHLTEVSASLAITVMVWLALRAKGPWGWAWVGAALAAATYVRPAFLFLALVVAIASGVSNHSWRPAAAVLSAFVLLVAPWSVRNYLLTDRIVPMAATSGSSLFASAEQYAGNISYKFTLEDWDMYRAQARRKVPRISGVMSAREELEADDAYRSAARRTFLDLGVGQVARSVPKRLAYLWGTADSPPAGRGGTALHRLGQAQYALLVLLTLAGLVMRRRRLLTEWPIWIVAVYLTLLHLVFHIEGRYTLPARPVLLVYAAIAAIVAAREVTDRRARVRGALRRA
jgi:hypothetical protein